MKARPVIRSDHDLLVPNENKHRCIVSKNGWNKPALKIFKFSFAPRSRI